MVTRSSDTTRGLLLGILLLTFIVYVPFLSNPLLQFDDNILITANPIIRQFTFANVWQAFTTFDPELYVPLTIFSFQVQHALTGFSPFWLHAGNLALHIGSVLLLFAIVKRHTERESIALIVAALFALHPLMTEAVLWAAARKDVLSAFFALLAVWWAPRNRWWSAAAFLLALLAKVSVAPLPLILLILDAHKEGKLTRQKVMHLWPMFALSIAFIIIALVGKSHNLVQVPLLTITLLGIKSAAFLLWKIFWPSDLSILYPQGNVSLLAPDILCAIIAWAALGILAVGFWLRKKQQLLLVLLSYLLLLGPNMTNVWKNGFLFFTSDRYAYLAAIPLFLLFAYGIDVATRKFPHRTKAIGSLVVIVLLALAGRTYVQAKTWNGDTALFRNVLAHYPDTPFALNNLGVSLGPVSEALQLYERAAIIAPTYAVPLRNIASYYYQMGDKTYTEDAYRRGIAILDAQEHVSHDEASTYFEYAEFLDEQGRLDEGILSLRKVVQSSPELPEAHFNLGIKLQKQGNMDEALPELKKAVDLAPANADFSYQLAAVYAEKGMLQEAEKLLEMVVKFDVQNVKAKEHLAAIRAILQQRR